MTNDSLPSGAPFQFSCEGLYQGFRESQKKGGDDLGYASFLLGGISTVSFRVDEAMVKAAGIKLGDNCLIRGRISQRTFQQTMVTEFQPEVMQRWTTVEKAAALGSSPKKS